MKKITLFILFALLASMAKPAGYKVGDEVKDFSLLNIDGKNTSLKDYADAKGFIIIFTCNHCPFSKAYEDRIIGLDKKYAGKGFPVIAINPNDPNREPEDSYENMKIRAKEKGFSFPYLIDESQNTANAFGAARTPHVFVVAREKSKLILKYIGAIDDNSDDPSAVTKHYTEDAVDALLQGKTVQTPETKAIGCSIKWKQQ